MAVAMAPRTLVNCIAPGILEGTRATSKLRPEMIDHASRSAVLKTAADKDDAMALRIVNFAKFLGNVQARRGAFTAQLPGREVL